MEANSTKETAKKIWHIVRAVFFMLRKATSKSKIMVDLNLLLKRSNKLAGKAINNLITFNHSNHHVYSSITCRSDDILSSFVSPQYVREYEFSCSNSPAFKYFNHHHHKRNKHYNYLHRKAKTYKYDDVSTVAAVQKVLEMLNSEVAAVESSPAVMGLPGLGKSPIVRQLRVTDSPFSLKDEEGDGGQVDKAAEEFINKFYKDLKKQKFSTSVFESPYYELMRAR